MRGLLILIICLGLLCSCEPSLSLVHPEGSSWMSRVDSEAPLRTLSIPATHDTCANFDFLSLSDTAKAQDHTLSQQLEMGVRAIDLRLHKDKIHHGVAYQFQSFKGVLDVLYSFLDSHPSETIVVMIMDEHTSHALDIIGYIEKAIEDNPEYWLSDFDLNTIKLGECRKKLLLLKRFSGAVMSMGIEYGVDQSTIRQSGAKYKEKDIDANWQRILDALDDLDPSRFNLVWSSFYYEGEFGIPNIRLASSKINPRLLEYLKDNDGYVGTIYQDQTTEELCYQIYRRNY